MEENIKVDEKDIIVFIDEDTISPEELQEGELYDMHEEESQN